MKRREERKQGKKAKRDQARKQAEERRKGEKGK